MVILYNIDKFGLIEKITIMRSLVRLELKSVVMIYQTNLLNII